MNVMVTTHMAALRTWQLPNDSSSGWTATYSSGLHEALLHATAAANTTKQTQQ